RRRQPDYTRDRAYRNRQPNGPTYFRRIQRHRQHGDTSRPRAAGETTLSGNSSAAFGDAARGLALSSRRMGAGAAVAQNDGRHAADRGDGKADRQPEQHENQRRAAAGRIEVSKNVEARMTNAEKSSNAPAFAELL